MYDKLVIFCLFLFPSKKGEKSNIPGFNPVFYITKIIKKISNLTKCIINLIGILKHVRKVEFFLSSNVYFKAYTV